MVAGIGGAVVAVPLVAVTNTVVGYLRAYSREAALRQQPKPHGATSSDAAPAIDRAPGSPQTKGPQEPPEAGPPSDASPA